MEISIYGKTKNAWAVDVQTTATSGKGGPVTHGVPNDKLSSHGGDGQIEPPEAQRRNSKDHTHSGGYETCSWKGEPEGPSCLHKKNRRGESTNSHKGPMTEGDLAGKAGEKIKAVGSNNKNTDHVCHMLHAKAEKTAQRRSNKGKTHEEEKDKSPHPDFYPESMEDLLVIFVLGMEQTSWHKNS